MFVININEKYDVKKFINKLEDLEDWLKEKYKEEHGKEYAHQPGNINVYL